MSEGRLHPELARILAQRFGIRSLRPVQRMAVDPILDGRDTVLLAPTAGGKTEAAFFPWLSRALTERPPGPSLLYICPLKALLNDLEPRLRAYAGAFGLEVFKWHGDVTNRERKAAIADPPDVLMITPESIEVILINRPEAAEALLEQVQTMIVDEVHAFADDLTGAHLLCLLERLERRLGRSIQRVGLSATVGNPGELAEWLAGNHDEGAPVVVDPAEAEGGDGGAGNERELSLNTASDLKDTARQIKRASERRRAIAFTGSRTRTEALGRQLNLAGVRTWVHHSAVSQQERESAEGAFERVPDGVIVSTSSLELGIDIGDLDMVFQIDAPMSVASLLQRLGRAGRRAGSASRMDAIALDPPQFLLLAAMFHLVEDGFVEPLRIQHAAWPVLVHQILALVLGRGGIGTRRLGEALRRMPPFSEIDTDAIADVVQHMVQEELLRWEEGLLVMGREGERRYGRRNFMELYAVFDTPRELTVKHQGREIGTLEAFFAHTLQEDRGRFILSGRPWVVIRRDGETLHVEPDQEGSPPAWKGLPMGLHRRVCEAVRELLVPVGEDSATNAMHGAERSGREEDFLTAKARRLLEHIRESYAHLRLHELQRPLELGPDSLVWHTFAGAHINAGLAKLLEARAGISTTYSNLTVSAQSDAPRKMADLWARVLRKAHKEPISDRQWAQWGEGLLKTDLSKFQPGLPPSAEREFVRDELFDVEGFYELAGLGFDGRCGR